MKQEIVIGTRESHLALWQAHWVTEQLQKLHPECTFRIKGIKTQGDKILDVALAKIGDKGLFTKELEMALLRGEIDMAVHSMKDVPTRLPDGLVIGAICRREHAGDVLISRQGTPLEKLPLRATVGTSSLRRTAQLLRFRPDLKVVTMRGNLHTRLRKMEEQGLDALVLAYAGVHRLGLEDRITQKIPFSICLPAVGQGSIGIEIRSNDEKTGELATYLDDVDSRAAIIAERAFMKRLEGGCQVPVGALGKVKDHQLVLEGVVLTTDGRLAVRDRICGLKEEAEELGWKLAEKLLEQGAGEILDLVRQGSLAK